MDKLALNLPGIQNTIQVSPFPGLTNNVANGTIGSITTDLLGITFMIAGFVSFIWALLGVYQYITAGGNKEGLGKARAKITWAIVGLLLTSLAFAVSGYVRQLSPQQTINVQNVTPP
jgi:hypothetical protein